MDNVYLLLLVVLMLIATQSPIAWKRWKWTGWCV
jgi:hypothetical protein